MKEDERKMVFKRLIVITLLFLSACSPFGRSPTPTPALPLQFSSQLRIEAAPVPSPTPKSWLHGRPGDCDYGWPGSTYPYCIRNDLNITATTWIVPDNTLSISICDYTGKYRGKSVSFIVIWTNLWAFWKVERVPGSGIITLHGQPGGSPCFTTRIPFTSVAPEDVPDVLELTSSYVPLVVIGESLTATPTHTPSPSPSPLPTSTDVPSPVPSTSTPGVGGIRGYAAHYHPGLMEQVASNRGMSQVGCMIASPYKPLGTWVTVTSLIKGNHHTKECRVTDICAKADCPRIRARGIVVELDFDSATELCNISYYGEEPPSACPVAITAP